MIQQKLEILKENEVIDRSTYEYMQQTLGFLKEKGVIQEDNEADTFITHLAMATARQHKQEEQVDSIDEMIKEEIETAAEYQEAVSLWKRIADLIQVDFPENENDYFYLHLVTLLQSKSQE